MIGLVTYAKQPNLTEDDRPLIDELRTLGHEAAPVRWDDPSANWSAFQALVLRSTWDYHLRSAEFLAWLDTIDGTGVPLWNPPALVLWNMHKGYLRELQEAGIAIPVTHWLSGGSARELRDIMGREKWREAIVKPAISASATDTFRVRADSADDAERFAALVERTEVLVQELIPEVAEHGEWSLMFIAGAYSHATIKRPRAGDFRVQQELGGSAEPATPSHEVIAAGERVVAQLPDRSLYVRVDGVETERGFLLMEAECIEPVLFFQHCDGSRRRFARALAELISE